MSSSKYLGLFWFPATQLALSELLESKPAGRKAGMGLCGTIHRAEEPGNHLEEQLGEEAGLPGIPGPTLPGHKWHWKPVLIVSQGPGT